VATALTRYFPPLAREKFAAHLNAHPLRREIISTHVINSAVNRVGGVFVHRLVETTGAEPPQVLRAYLLAREIFGFVPMWQAIEALDNRVADSTQAGMLLALLDLTTRVTAWFLRSRRLPEDMAATIATFRPGIEALQQSLPELLDSDAASELTARIARYRDSGVPDALAHQVATIEGAYAALDIIEIASTAKQTPEAVAKVHFELERVLSLAWLRLKILALPEEGHWQSLAKAAMADDVGGLQRALALQIFAPGTSETTATARLEGWERKNREALERARTLLTELRTLPSPDAAMLAVALRELRALT
jgi:glutamate dehydrogenase